MVNESLILTFFGSMIAFTASQRTSSASIVFYLYYIVIDLAVGSTGNVVEKSVVGTDGPSVPATNLLTSFPGGRLLIDVH